jgi:hypothetical protein
MCNPGTDNLPHFCDGPDDPSSPGYCLPNGTSGVCVPKCLAPADGSPPGHLQHRGIPVPREPDRGHRGLPGRVHERHRLSDRKQVPARYRTMLDHRRCAHQDPRAGVHERGQRNPDHGRQLQLPSSPDGNAGHLYPVLHRRLRGRRLPGRIRVRYRRADAVDQSDHDGVRTRLRHAEPGPRRLLLADRSFVRGGRWLG